MLTFVFPSSSMNTMQSNSYFRFPYWKETCFYFFLGIFVRLWYQILHLRYIRPLHNEEIYFNPFPYYPLLDTFYKWDSRWYYKIITEGYVSSNDIQTSAAFFPLYPYLSKSFGYLIGSPLIAGLMISHIAWLAALLLISHFPSTANSTALNNLSTAQQRLLLILTFPAAFFSSMFYTEGLYCFLVASSFYFYAYQRITWASLFGMLACATRPTGIILFVAFLGAHIMTLFREKQFRMPPWSIFLIPLGLAAVCILFEIKLNDPFAFMHAQKGWREAGFTWPWLTLWGDLFRGFQSIWIMIDVLITCCLLLLGCLALYYRDYAGGLYILGITFLALSTGTTLSMTRFASTIIPFFLILQRILASRRHLFITVLIFFLVTQCFLLTRYMASEWAG